MSHRGLLPKKWAERIERANRRLQASAPIPVRHLTPAERAHQYPPDRVDALLAAASGPSSGGVGPWAVEMEEAPWVTDDLAYWRVRLRHVAMEED